QHPHPVRALPGRGRLARTGLARRNGSGLPTIRRSVMSTFVVGLTGGIASGKTTVSDLFAELGVPVIDADIAAREVVEPGTPGLAQLVEAFGDGILDEQGRLDRRGLRNIVFADPAARRRLEQITHPLIHQRLRSEEHTSELQSRENLVCRLLLEKKK